MRQRSYRTSYITLIAAIGLFSALPLTAQMKKRLPQMPSPVASKSALVTQKEISPVALKASQGLGVVLTDPTTPEARLDFVETYLDIGPNEQENFSTILENSSLNKVLVEDAEYGIFSTSADTLGYFPTDDPAKPIFLLQINFNQSYEYGSVYAYRYEDLIVFHPSKNILDREVLSALVDQIMLEEIGETDFADLTQEGYRLEATGRLTKQENDGSLVLIEAPEQEQKLAATLLVPNRADEISPQLFEEVLKTAPFLKTQKVELSPTWKIWLETLGDGIRVFGYDFKHPATQYVDGRDRCEGNKC